jgi:hypothetical protein
MNMIVINRTFTTEESEAIASISATSQSDRVELAYQTNPDKSYTYVSTSGSFVTKLNDTLAQGASVGSLVFNARRSGELKEATV